MRKLKIFIQIIKILLTDWELTASLFKNSVYILLLRSKAFLWRRKYIIVSLTEHLGDIVAAEPVSRYVKERFPGSNKIWVVDKKFEEVIYSNPNIDQAIKVCCFTEWILLKHLLPRSRVLDMHLNNKICSRHHFIYTKSNNPGITLENYFEKGNLLYAFSRSASIDIPESTPPLLHLKEHPAILPSNYIVIHAGSNNPDKMWEDQCWNRLSGFILDEFDAISIVEIGLENKITLKNERITRFTGAKQLSLIATVINKSILFIGVDSSFAHFANALEKESLVLIGSLKHFNHYMPYSGKFEREEKNNIIYYNNPLNQMPCDHIFSAVKNRLHSIL